MLRGRASGWLIVAATLIAAHALVVLAEAVLSEPVLEQSLGDSAVELVFAALALAGALIGRGSVRQRLGLLRPRLGLRDTAMLVAGTLALSHALDALIAETGLYEQSALAGFARSLYGTRGLPLVAMLVAIGLLPAFAEELLCRGLIQRSLVPRVGPVAGIALASLLFGALHIEPVHAGFATLLGVYLGIIGFWAGSVWTPIVCHAVNNLLAVAVAVHAGPTDAGSPAEIALGLGLAAAALLWIRTRGKAGLQPASGSVDG